MGSKVLKCSQTCSQQSARSRLLAGPPRAIAARFPSTTPAARSGAPAIQGAFCGAVGSGGKTVVGAAITVGAAVIRPMAAAKK